MDPAASVISIIDAALKITHYIKDVSDSRKERQLLNRQILSVYTLLLAVQDQFAAESWASDTAWARTIRPLLQPDGAIDQLRTTVEEIADRLTVPSHDRVKRLARALKWPFDKEENQRLVDRISSHLVLINTAIGQANIELGKETNSGIAHLKTIVDAQAFNETLDWISPLDFPALQETAEKRPVKGTGRWFLEHPSYKSWSFGRVPILWCHGIPGAGKTLLASAAFDHMKDFVKEERAALLVAFCQFDEKRSHSALEILSAMLRQAVRVQSHLSESIRKMYTEHTSGQKQARPSLDQTCDALAAELSKFEKAFIVLDGLDEMPEQKERAELLQRLESLKPRPSLIVTSRPLPEIRDWFIEYAAYDGFHVDEEDVEDDENESGRYCDDCDDGQIWSQAVYGCSNCSRDYCVPCSESLEECSACGENKSSFACNVSRAVSIAAQPQDLELYIDWRIDNSEKLRNNIARATNKTLRQDIIDRVLADAQDMFLIAKLHMNVLVDQLSARKVKEALDKLPRELDDHYEKIFQRIDRSAIATTLRLFLAIIASATVLLTVDALSHAIAMNDGVADRDELEESIPDMKSLASLCAGLVDIDGLGCVRLAHETTGNYIKKSKHETFENRHELLATICLNYLKLPAFSEGPCTGTDVFEALEQRKEDYPFFSYAALHWGYHVGRAKDVAVKSLASRLLGCQQNVEAAVQIMWHDGLSWDAEISSGIHVGAHYGLLSAVSQLLADGADVNAQDCLGTTALMYAAAAGHSDVVELLLHSGADPSIICDRGCSALHRACQYDRLEIVRQLVESNRDIAINALDARYSHRSALMWAIEGEFPEIVTLLLQRGDLRVNDSRPDRYGSSALHHAASLGQTAMVKALIGHQGIDINAVDNSNATALNDAASNGEVDVVELLLTENADTEVRDVHGGTAILRAVDNQHLDCVRLLVKHGADVHFKDFFGRNLLMGCAVNNVPTVLRYFLEEVESMDPNAQGNRGETALHDAVLRDYDECVRVLLEFGARTDILDNAGRSAVRAARENNSHRSLALLREARFKEIEQDAKQNSFNKPKRADTFGLEYKQPIHSAVRFLDPEALHSYLESLGPELESSINQIDIDMKQTPLHVAARRGKAKAVTWLLDHGATVGVHDMWMWTPLHLAAEMGYEEIATMLLDRGADINALDFEKRTPLELATSQYLQPEIAFLLIKRDASFDTYARYLYTLLSWACDYGELEVVKRLVKAGVPFQLKDEYGLSPYHRAKKQEHEKTATFLFEEAERRKRKRSQAVSGDQVPTLKGMEADFPTEDSRDGLSQPVGEDDAIAGAEATSDNQADVSAPEQEERTVDDDYVLIPSGTSLVEARTANMVSDAGNLRAGALSVTVREAALLSVIVLLVALLILH